MTKRPTDIYDDFEKPVEIKNALDQGAAQRAWTKLTEYRKTNAQTIFGKHNRFYCIKNHEELGAAHYSIEVFPPGSDRNKEDARLTFVLLRTGKGKYTVLPPATILEGEEFEINARDANAMLAEIAAGTKEVHKETVVDGIKLGTRRKAAKV
jgi:hypothetical protein